MDKRIFSALCELDGVSGHEEAVRNYIVDCLKETGTPMEITVDGMGNLLVHLIGREHAHKKVQFDAHMDEVGFIITHINEDGTLCFDTLGRMNDHMLFGRRVRIGGNIGVIGGKAIHQCEKDEKTKVPTMDAMRIDLGCESKEAVSKLVSLGDVGTFDNGITWFNEDIFCGKAVDDRVGCALLLELAKEQPQRDIWLSFSVQEELGLRGAGVATEAIHPDFAVAIDATTAADTPGNAGAATVCCVGKGAVVPFADGATLYEHELYKRVHALAEQNGIPAQTKTKIAGANNAGAIQRRHSGVHTITVSLPCRYIHSPACLGSAADVDSMARLLKLLALELTQ